MTDTPMTREEGKIEGPYQATPRMELERQIMSACVPKNEREWWAQRTIAALREELACLKRSRLAAETYLPIIATLVDMKSSYAPMAGGWCEELCSKITGLREELAQMEREVASYKNVIAANQREFAKLEDVLAQVKRERDDIIQDFIHGKDKLCLVCGAKEPCELKDDPSSPCTFDPTPMELLAAYRRQVKQIDEVIAEAVWAMEWLEEEGPSVPMGNRGYQRTQTFLASDLVAQWRERQEGEA
jgi:hypothetical protein